MFGRLRAPVVITTTVHANADELQVSTTVEENTGDASASGCRLVTSQQSIASNVAKPQSAPVKSWIDRTSTQPTPREGLRGGHWDGAVYGDCRSTQCCVAVWSIWLELATRRVGFRALKKTLEGALCTTKREQYRVHTVSTHTRHYSRVDTSQCTCGIRPTHNTVLCVCVFSPSYSPPRQHTHMHTI